LLNAFWDCNFISHKFGTKRVFCGNIISPAEIAGLICNLLSILKMCPSAFRVSSPQTQRGRGSNQHQNLPWTHGDVRGKFHQDSCRGLDFH